MLIMLKPAAYSLEKCTTWSPHNRQRTPPENAVWHNVIHPYWEPKSNKVLAVEKNSPWRYSYNTVYCSDCMLEYVWVRLRRGWADHFLICSPIHSSVTFFFKLIGKIYETVQIESSTLAICNWNLFLTFRNVWNPFSPIPSSLSSNPRVQLLYTWSHTVNFSPLCLKKSYSCHHRGGSFWAGPNLKWHRTGAEVKCRQKSTHAAVSNKASALSLDKHSSWRQVSISAWHP